MAVPAKHPNCLQGTGRAKSLLNEMYTRITNPGNPLAYLGWRQEVFAFTALHKYHSSPTGSKLVLG